MADNLTNILKVADIDKLKKEVNEQLSAFKVDTVNADNYQSTKKDRATIVKLGNGIDAERKRLNKELKGETDKLEKLVNDKLLVIDTALGKYEQQMKDDRLIEIYDYFETLKCPVEFEKIYVERWLNITANWQDELTTEVSRIKNDIKTLETFEVAPRLLELYKRSLSIEEAKQMYSMEQKIDIVNKSTTLGGIVQITELAFNEHTITFFSTDEVFEEVKKEVAKLVDITSAV